MVFIIIFLKNNGHFLPTMGDLASPEYFLDLGGNILFYPYHFNLGTAQVSKIKIFRVKNNRKTLCLAV